MSGLHVPRWLAAVMAAADGLHKATHPSRWGEDKPCECGELTRRECAMRDYKECWRRDEHEDGGP